MYLLADPLGLLVMGASVGAAGGGSRRFELRSAIAAVFVVGIVAGVIPMLRAEPASAQVPTGSVEFVFTGAPQSWTVPDGVTAVQVEAYGAQGGLGNSIVEYAGLGGFVRATLPVTPGVSDQRCNCLDLTGWAPGGVWPEGQASDQPR